MEISQVLKAMSHPVRLQMVELLLQRQMCVRSLARHFDVSKPTISVHLKLLKNARPFLLNSENSPRLKRLQIIKKWLSIR